MLAGGELRELSGCDIERMQVFRTIACEVAVARILLEVEPRDHERLRALRLVAFRGHLQRRVGEAEQETRLVRRKADRVDALLERRDLLGLAEGCERKLPQLALAQTVGEKVELGSVLRPPRIRGVR